MSSLPTASLLRLLPIFFGSLVISCTPGEIGPFADHAEDEDFTAITAPIPGIPSSFNRHEILSDEVFTNTDLTGDMVQGFLENAPYSGGIRSWLADVEVNGERASDALVAAAKAKGINPLMLLARLQVEKSAVSRSTRPSQHQINYTMGCGCHDGQSCNSAYRGFDKQMDCVADTLRRHFDGSVEESGQWRQGRSGQTLDSASVTPVNHGTASLYAYTPWVLRGTGGNWLVWNVTLKYANAFARITPVAPTGSDSDPSDSDPGSSSPDPDPGSSEPTASAWIGTSCQLDDSCDLSHGGVSDGECLSWFDQDAATLFGFCSIACEGFCTDQFGEAPTFCTEVAGQGQCVAAPAAENNFCSAIPGTRRISKPRFVGNSGAEVVWRDVCAPGHEALSCNAGSSVGECIDTSTNSCSVTPLANACPGPSAIRCCAQ